MKKSPRFLILPLLVFLCFAFALLYSCGEDNSASGNNGGNGSGTLIFSLDSLAINLPNDSIFVNDTAVDILNSENIRVEFECATNSDSINSISNLTLKADIVDTNNIYHQYFDSTLSTISTLNNSYSFAIVGSSYYKFTFRIQLFRINPVNYFIRLRNLRIFRT